MSSVKISSSVVSRTPAAAPDLALAHFQSLMSFETDCWDVHHATVNKTKDFVLLDVRAEKLYQKGHLMGATCLPHSRIKQSSLSQYPLDTLFVVYCAGPHCNGADKAAIKLAKLNRPVKKLIGGVTGWLDEGFSLIT